MHHPRKDCREGTNAHNRSEDLLTSTAFELLDYLPASEGVFPLLKRAWRITAAAEDNASIQRGIRVPFNAADRSLRYLSQVFAGQNVGVTQVGDRIWLVTFMRYDLGYFDDETCRLEPIENPFAPKLLPMSPE